MINFILVIYSCVLFSGAYFGLKAGSRISLYMGVISGALILISVYLMGKNPQYGFMSAAIVSGFLSLVFFIRVLKTRKFMPSGMLFTVSVAVFVLNCVQILKS